MHKYAAKYIIICTQKVRVMKCFSNIQLSPSHEFYFKITRKTFPKLHFAFGHFKETYFHQIVHQLTFFPAQSSSFPPVFISLSE